MLFKCHYQSFYIFRSFTNQIIFTATLKDEKLGKYEKANGINAIDYSGNIDSHILNTQVVDELFKTDYFSVINHDYRPPKMIVMPMACRYHFGSCYIYCTGSGNSCNFSRKYLTRFTEKSALLKRNTQKTNQVVYFVN